MKKLKAKETLKDKVEILKTPDEVYLFDKKFQDNFLKTSKTQKRSLVRRRKGLFKTIINDTVEESNNFLVNNRRHSGNKERERPFTQNTKPIVRRVARKCSPTDKRLILVKRNTTKVPLAGR